MGKIIDLILSPSQFTDKAYISEQISLKSKIKVCDIKDFRVIRKSIDARKGVKYNVKIEFITHDDEEFLPLHIPLKFEKIKDNSRKVVIVGAGPAGYFAALSCLIEGLKPIVLERGKSIEERKKDIALINRNISLNPESNYAFGEGGAGTYSDGKLYTRSKKRGDINQILNLLVQFGANPDILIDSHPHIGTDKLPRIMQNIRNQILNCGGEVYFNTKVTEIIIESGVAKAVKTETGLAFYGDYIVLATGHSARDVYDFLNKQNIKLENKGFAMGVRIEHPQELINQIQYGKSHTKYNLPPASYSIVGQFDNRGVYSFCMCPGGTIVNASTNNTELVVNGMSNSLRNSAFANSGIVVEIQPEDYENFYGKNLFAGLIMQAELEKIAFHNAGSRLKAPAQRLQDFVKGKLSSSIPESSYNPGLVSSPIHFWLPDFISKRLQKAFKSFDNKMKGFITNDAIVVGVESRTSSPVKIVRNNNFESVSIKNLFPCGEGAGYAGGIISSAIDGMSAIKKIIELQ